MTSPLGFPDLRDVATIDEHPLLERSRAVADDRPVLIEVLADDAAADRVFVDSHPGLLSTLAVSETDDGRCAVLWPADETLAERLAANGALPWHRAAQLVAVVADAVDHAHDRGHRHGAIDPGAVQFGPDHQPVLGGFGLADIRRRAVAMGGPVGFAADPRFAAPEIGAAGDATVAGDVYSLGALLSAALVGGAPAAQPDVLDDDAPEQLVAVVAMAMAVDLDHRYRSAADLAAAVRAARDAALYGDDEAEAVAPPPTPAAAPSGSNGAAPPVVLPPLDTDSWYASDQNADWAESLGAVVADIEGVPIDDDGIELLPGLDDVDGRMIITLAEAERGAAGHGNGGPPEGDAGTPSGRSRATLGNEAGATITVADAEAAVVEATEPAEPARPSPVTAGPPVMVVESGRVELDEPVDGDILVTGGQLVVRAEVHGSLHVDGGRAVVFAPVSGDVINGGGTVSVEARVCGRIRGQREFTTVRPGSQA